MLRSSAPSQAGRQQSLHRRVDMRSFNRLMALFAMAVVLALGYFQEAAGQAAPAGEGTIAWHVTIAPTRFDPSSAPPQITPFGTLSPIPAALVPPPPTHKT